MSLEEAVQSNNKRASLIALRDKIAATIETTDSGRDIAALSKRLMEVMNEIDATPDASKESATPMGRRRAKKNA